jgi:cyanophycinase-like exopeptidase
VSGPVALHGGGEYLAGDEAAMDALLEAALRASGGTAPVRVVLVPTAVARHRPDLATAHGTRAFRDAAARAGVAAEVLVAPVLARTSAADPAVAALFDGAHLVHLPGGDPDLVPTILRDTPAWLAILRAHAAGACLAGASAGAMALAARLWTPGGPMEGLGVVPGLAVLPHHEPGRMAAWRRIVDPADGLAWLGLDEQTLVMGTPGSRWLVAGRGRAHLVLPGVRAPVTAGPGESLVIA